MPTTTVYASAYGAVDDLGGVYADTDYRIGGTYIGAQFIVTRGFARFDLSALAGTHCVTASFSIYSYGISLADAAMNKVSDVFPLTSASFWSPSLAYLGPLSITGAAGYKVGALPAQEIENAFGSLLPVQLRLVDESSDVGGYVNYPSASITVSWVPAPITTSGSFSAGAVITSPPTWVSPARNASFAPLTPLVWTSVPQDTSAHFVLEISASVNFADPYRFATYKGDAGFEYWDGAAWVQLGPTGMPSNKTGNQVRYTQWSRGGGWFRRVKQSSRG